MSDAFLHIELSLFRHISMDEQRQLLREDSRAVVGTFVPSVLMIHEYLCNTAVPGYVA
jgi:hypothetical protein